MTSVELGQVAGRSPDDETATFIITVLLFMAIATYGAMVLSGVVEEKASRVVEVLLARIPARNLLAGKIAGIGLLGLGQIAVTALAAFMAVTFVSSVDLPAVRGSVLAWAVVWFIVGYALYASVFGALGSLASRPEDAQSTAGPVSVVLVLVYFISFAAIGSAHTNWARAVAWFPASAPIAMPSRIAMGTATWWDPLVALALTGAAIAGLVIELDRIHRFTHPWERQASLGLRRGNPEAFDAYDNLGRLHDGTRIDMQRAALTGWTEHRKTGGRVVMLAVTNDTVHALNDAAQSLRVRAGDLHPNRLVEGRACRVHVGDEIVTRTNDRTLHTDHGVMVRNRAPWTVTGIGGDGSVTARNADGTVRLPASYLSTSVELGYAQTVHGAQGATVDHSLLIVDGPLDGRALYVGLTRGVDSNHAYVAVDGNRTGRDILDAAIVADWTDTPAIDIRAELAARPLTPFAPSVRDQAAQGLAVEQLRTIHDEHRALRTLDLSFRDQRLQRLETDDHGDRQQLQQAHSQRHAVTRELATVTAQRAVLPDFGHRHQRRDLDHRITQLHQQRVKAGRDIPSLEHRIAQRAPELTVERHWAVDHVGLQARQRHLEHALRLDAAARGHAATHNPRSYLTDTLGPVPDDPGRQLEWERAAGGIEQHRTIYGITDPHHALGPASERNDLSDRAIEQQRLQRQAQLLQHEKPGPELVVRPGPVVEL